MAQECGFFDAYLVGEEYDRVYLAVQFAAYFAAFIGNGIFGHSMQQLEVASQDTPNMSTKVLAGEGWINGYWYRNTDAYTLNHTVADGVLSRIDTVVLRWSNSDRAMYLHILEGTPSSNPVAPALVRDSDYYDLGLAHVSIPAGSIRITQAQIQDLRLSSEYCGLVTGLVDQADLTDIFNQFEQYFLEFKQTHEADFDEWSEEQKQAFLTYVSYQKGLYDSYIAKMEKDYDDWTSEKKTEWAQWVTTQETEFTDWVTEEERLYDEWTEAQRQAYANWYTTNTEEWTAMFMNWFDSIKGKLAEDIAGALQLEIDELNAKQPEVQVAEIEHNMNAYIHCDLYETTYAAGVQGAGEGPAGGAAVISSPVEYEMADRNNIIVRAIAGLGEVEAVNQISDNIYAVVFTGKLKSLVVILDDRGISIKRSVEQIGESKNEESEENVNETIS